MKGVARNIWNVLGAVLYVVLAISCLIGIFGVATTSDLSLSRKAFMILAFALGAFFLVCSAIGIFHRIWRKDNQEEEGNE